MWLTGVPGRPIWGIRANLDHCARNRQGERSASRGGRHARVRMEGGLNETYERSTSCSPGESRLVPAADDPHLALEAEHANAAGRQEEPSAEAHRLLHPPRGEGAQDVAVGEEGDVAARAEDLVDDAVAARADLVGRL